jgi:sterol desaturase/sphingolipid hydroxylase (fatty acid hydroxylase superfamily)
MNRDSAFTSLRLPSHRSLAYAVGVLILFLVALLGLPNFVVRTVEFLPNSIRWILTDPKTFWAVGIITCLEWLFPANRSQPAFSAGYVQDLLCFFVWIAIVAAGVQIYVEFLNSLFKTYLGFLVIDASSLPWFALLVISFLVGDLLAWFHHLVRHKVALFWRFHALHHSQTQMSLFTDFRVHPMEYLIAQTIIILPSFILGTHLSGRAGDIYWLAILITWYTRFYHANIRMNLGWLKYVLVTPQSHRVHHSACAEHADKNFGVMLCIWDRMFGTHCDEDCYPSTGVPDPYFPMPTSRSPRSVVTSYLHQLVYPFLPAKREQRTESE